MTTAPDFNAPAPSVRRSALEAWDVGLCPIPAADDGSKRPFGQWKQYQSTRPTLEQVEQWFVDDVRPGFGVICGAVSGGLEMLELEGRAMAEGMWDTFCQKCDEAGIGALLDSIVKGYSEQTPSGGLHLLFVVDGAPRGNLKLARRKVGTDVQVFIETRGEGGFVVLAPSQGSTHPSGLAWEVQTGSLSTVVVVTEAERDALYDVARSFDEMSTDVDKPTPRNLPESQQVSADVDTGQSIPLRTWSADELWMDDFCEVLDARPWAEVLRKYGWEHRHDAEGIGYWARPELQHEGHSATTNGLGTDRFMVFSSSTPFESYDGVDKTRTYDRLDVIAAYEYDGDRNAAARAMRDDVLGTATATEPPRLFGKRWSVAELLAADLTYEWDVRGLVVRPTYGVDTGELKTLKSYFGMARLIGLAAGVPVLGRWEVPQRRRVLCFVAEGGRVPFTRRLIRMCEAHGVDVNDLDGWLETVYDAAPLNSEVFRDTLRGHLADFQPALVHLDPLYPFQPMTVDSNKLSQVGLMLNEVQAICAAHEATFWITAHMNQTGNGFDLKRIAGAGVGEWGDSWCLLGHRETPDVGRGLFRLKVVVGSRQWGGGEFHVDWDIGHFDDDRGAHDGPITFNVTNAGAVSASVDKDDEKRLLARRAVLATMRHAKMPLSKTEIDERTSGPGKTHVRAEYAVLADDGILVVETIRKPEKGGKDTCYTCSPRSGEMPDRTVLCTGEDLPHKTVRLWSKHPPCRLRCSTRIAPVQRPNNRSVPRIAEPYLNGSITETSHRPGACKAPAVRIDIATDRHR